MVASAVFRDQRFRLPANVVCHRVRLVRTPNILFIWRENLLGVVDLLLFFLFVLVGNAAAKRSDSWKQIWDFDRDRVAVGVHPVAGGPADPTRAFPSQLQTSCEGSSERWRGGGHSSQHDRVHQHVSRHDAACEVVALVRSGWTFCRGLWDWERSVEVGLGGDVGVEHVCT